MNKRDYESIHRISRVVCTCRVLLPWEIHIYRVSECIFDFI